MDFLRSSQFYTSSSNTPIHVIGVGAIGSHLVKEMGNYDIHNPIHIYDMDYVEDHNLVNQYYFPKDIGKLKTDALAENVPHLNIIKHGRYDNEYLEGYVFLMLGDMSERKRIMKEIISFNINGIIEARLGYTNGIVYAFEPSLTLYSEWLNKSDYTDDETTQNLCGTKTVISLVVEITIVQTMCCFIDMDLYHKGEGDKLPDFENKVELKLNN